MSATTSAVKLKKAARVAEQALYAAGTHLLASRARLSEVLITRKRPEDVVRSIERESKALIHEVVLHHFPEHGFLSDEADSWCLADQPQWVVAPLDGRINYLRGFPQYAVAMALVIGGEPHLGAVFDPSRNEFFGALRDVGAVLNGAPIRCAPPKPVQQALAATVFPPPDSPRLATYLSEFGRVLEGFGEVRRSNAMLLEMAQLAAGRADAYWQHDLRAWEAAAGLALLRESGLRVEARDGAPLLLSESLVAATPALHDTLRGLLGDA